MCAHVMERSLHPGFCCVILNYYVQCGGMLCTIGSGIEIEVGVKRRVPLLPWGRVASRPETTLEAQSLAYIPGVCVFPARSCFTPGWAYVAHIIYGRTLSSLEDNLKMASRGRNM